LLLARINPVGNGQKLGAAAVRASVALNAAASYTSMMPRIIAASTGTLEHQESATVRGTVQGFFARASSSERAQIEVLRNTSGLGGSREL
jgi:hypothetical protein